MKIEGKSTNKTSIATRDAAGIPDLGTFILDFEADASAPSLVLLAADAPGLLDQVKSHFKYIEAAGGLVLNPRGEVLTIFRLGKWDLPKGKREKGESVEACAAREVEEECGIASPRVVAPLPSTYHTYRVKGKLVLKQTYWFEMSYDGPLECKPQLEEDISLAVWTPVTDLAKVHANTYPSVIDVLGNHLPGCKR